MSLRGPPGARFGPPAAHFDPPGGHLGPPGGQLGPPGAHVGPLGVLLGRYYYYYYYYYYYLLLLTHGKDENGWRPTGRLEEPWGAASTSVPQHVSSSLSPRLAIMQLDFPEKSTSS